MKNNLVSLQLKILSFLYNSHSPCLGATENKNPNMSTHVLVGIQDAVAELGKRVDAIEQSTPSGSGSGVSLKNGGDPTAMIVSLSEQLTKRIAATKDGFAKDFSDLKTQIADVSTSQAALKTRVADVEASQAALKIQIADVEDSIADVETSQAALKTAISALESEVSQLQTAFGFTQERIKSLERGVETSQALEKRLADLELRSETEHQAISQRIDELAKSRKKSTATTAVARGIDIAETISADDDDSSTNELSTTIQTTATPATATSATANPTTATSATATPTAALSAVTSTILAHDDAETHDGDDNVVTVVPAAKPKKTVVKKAAAK